MFGNFTKKTVQVQYSAEWSVICTRPYRSYSSSMRQYSEGHKTFVYDMYDKVCRYYFLVFQKLRKVLKEGGLNRSKEVLMTQVRVSSVRDEWKKPLLKFHVSGLW